MPADRDNLDVSDLVGELMRLSVKGREPVKLRFKTTATEAVSEGRPTD